MRSPGLSVKESDFSPAVIRRRLGRGKTGLSAEGFSNSVGLRDVAANPLQNAAHDAQSVNRAGQSSAMRSTVRLLGICCDKVQCFHFDSLNVGRCYLFTVPVATNSLMTLKNPSAIPVAAPVIDLIQRAIAVLMQPMTCVFSPSASGLFSRSSSSYA